MTLKHKLMVATLAAVLMMAAVMSTIIGFNYYSFGRSTVYTKTESVASAVSENLSDWLETQGRILNAVARYHTESPSESALTQARESGGFYDVYFGSANGNMYTSLIEELPEGYDPRQRDWYRQAVSAGAQILTASYQDVATLETTVTFAQPLYRNGQLLGVLAADLVLNDLIDNISSISLGENTHALLFEGNRILSHYRSDLLQQPINRIHNQLSIQTIQQSINDQRIFMAERDEGSKLYHFVPVQGSDWMLAIELDLDTEMAFGYASFFELITAGTLVLLLVMGLSSLLVNYLFRDLTYVSQALQTIANGEGDLRQRLDPRSQDEVGLLANNFNQFVGHMHGMVMRMRSIAEQLSAQSSQAAAQAQQRSVSIRQQQDDIAGVATAISQMSTTTQEVAGHAEETARTSHESVNLSSKGTQQVAQSQQSITRLAAEVETATEVITALDAHTQSINTILAAIQGIAEQTNLLALNAAIEAARAGSQGRGFAVVADEVRVLSQRTHDSTSEIQSTIETLQRVTAEAVMLMRDSHQLANTSVDDAEQAAQSLQQITTSINEISDMATHIASAAEEQSLVSNEIKRNTQGISQVSEEMAAEAIESAAQATALSDLAYQLQSEVSKFRV